MTRRYNLLTPAEAALMTSREWRLDNLYRIVNEPGRTSRSHATTCSGPVGTALVTGTSSSKAASTASQSFILLLMLDTCLFNPNTHCGLIDATLIDATKKLDKARFAYEQAAPRHQSRRPAQSRQRDITGMEERLPHRRRHLAPRRHAANPARLRDGQDRRRAPKRSREIRTGAFGTVHAGQMVFVESTAAGAAGDFFDLVQEADAAARSGKTARRPGIQADLPAVADARRPTAPTPSTVLIPKELTAYFDELHHTHRIPLDAQQRAWYAMTQQKLGPDNMSREFPSYPEEAFKVSIEGAYFKAQMTKAREQRRIGKVAARPITPRPHVLGYRQVRQHRHLVLPVTRQHGPPGGLLREQRGRR